MNRRKSTSPSSSRFCGADVYWATIAYAGAWWTRDGVYLGSIRRQKMLTPEIVGKIAHTYSINRGWKKDETRNIKELFCGIMNIKSISWPHTMGERADFCIEILEECISQELFRNEQISAITKFMWFLKPNEWTPFDNYAALGVGIGPTAQTTVRMKSFYNRLIQYQFESLSNEMQILVNKTEFCGLPSTRILDMVLMERGKQQKSNPPDISRFEDFLSLLPEPTRKPLHKLASDLQTKFGNDVLTDRHVRDAA